MTTRSGLSYQKEFGSWATGAMSTETETGTASGEATGANVDLTEMMRLLIEDRRKREAEYVEERKRREADMDRRTREMEKQMELLREMVRGSTGPTADADRTADHRADRVRLARLSESDDIESYLTTFERMMTAYEVPRSRWVFQLAPQLTAKAQQAYTALSTSDAADYTKVKEAILVRYNINSETYRQRVRGVRKQPNETYPELATRVLDLTNKWTRECTTVQELREVIAMEQFLNTLPENLRIWVRERKPATASEAGQLAEDYLQARGAPQSARRIDAPGPKGETDSRSGLPENRRCHECGQTGHLAKDCNSRRTGIERGRRPIRGGDVKCYSCGQKGHLAMRCPAKALFCERQGGQPTRRAVPPDIRVDSTLCFDRGTGVYRSGKVEGVPVSDILLDTGCSRTLVRQELVPTENLRMDRIAIRCAHGDTIEYPLADVLMEIGDKQFTVEAGVSNTLPTSVLLGTDVPEMTELLRGGCFRPRLPKEDHPEKALVVETRAQARVREREEAIEKAKELGSAAQPKPVDLTISESGAGEVNPIASQSGETNREQLQEADNRALTEMSSAFAEDLFENGRSRQRLTRSQKRIARYEHSRQARLAGEGRHPLDVTSKVMNRQQQQDPTLERVREAVEQGPDMSTGTGFFQRNGLIYRQWTPKDRTTPETVVEQLVLPACYRKEVMKLAHSVPLAGHMGKTRTAKRIMQRFYWPSLFRDVAEYCRSCEACQKCPARHTPRAHLIPLPVITEPFSRIGMDIVGPLPKSRAGNRYVLVICDYATRYPEAVAMKNIDAEHVAEHLVEVFSRVGIPQEILTDQGSNFMSQLLKEVYNLLHVSPIRTSPYHPQTDGLVERFNQTLKTMLRKSAKEDGKDWDKLLPYILFAYREVPQSSTGFSPFELLFGRQVRGPLDILKENWEAQEKSSESVVSYVLAMRDRLAQMTELVQHNLGRAQRQQKRWYDCNARSREFQPGEDVLVLLPTSTNKLLARWQGPYPVVRAVGRVNYEVDMYDRRKRLRVFHVNMLRKWHSPAEVACYAEESPVESDGDDPVTWEGGQRPTTEEQPILGEGLGTCQLEQLHQLLQDSADILTSEPGRTGLTEHCIDIDRTRPIRLPPYRLPHAYRDQIREELRDMEEKGVIEPSVSEWSFPIVPVKK